MDIMLEGHCSWLMDDSQAHIQIFAKGARLVQRHEIYSPGNYGVNIG